MTVTRHPLDVAEKRLLEERHLLSFDEAAALAALPLTDLPALVALSHRVLIDYCGDGVELESIISAKTGACPEDCAFCSQSIKHDTDIDVHPMVEAEVLVDAAKTTERLGGSHFCIVVAVQGPDRNLFEKVIEGIKAVRANTSVGVACSLGILSKEQAERLVEAGVETYNHNLETARSFFPNVCTTHTYDDRRNTCIVARDAGMELCSGGIMGMGETVTQRLELAFELRDIGVMEVPLNFLNPRPGTPLGDKAMLDPREAVQTIALFRLVLPSALLRYAGGREEVLRELQSFGMYAGINGLIVGDYLTTFGRGINEDLQMLEDLGRPVVNHRAHEGIVSFVPGERPRFMAPGAEKPGYLGRDSVAALPVTPVKIKAND